MPRGFVRARHLDAWPCRHGASRSASRRSKLLTDPIRESDNQYGRQAIAGRRGGGSVHGRGRAVHRDGGGVVAGSADNRCGRRECDLLLSLIVLSVVFVTVAPSARRSRAGRAAAAARAPTLRCGWGRQQRAAEAVHGSRKCARRVRPARAARGRAATRVRRATVRRPRPARRRVQRRQAARGGLPEKRAAARASERAGTSAQPDLP